MGCLTSLFFFFCSEQNLWVTFHSWERGRLGEQKGTHAGQGRQELQGTGCVCHQGQEGGGAGGQGGNPASSVIVRTSALLSPLGPGPPQTSPRGPLWLPPQRRKTGHQEVQGLEHSREHSSRSVHPMIHTLFSSVSLKFVSGCGAQSTLDSPICCPYPGSTLNPNPL